MNQTKEEWILERVGEMQNLALSRSKDGKEKEDYTVFGDVAIYTHDNLERFLHRTVKEAEQRVATSIHDKILNSSKPLLVVLDEIKQQFGL